MPDRTLAPAFTRTTDFELIRPEKIVLDNGLKIYNIAGANQPVMRIELILKAGRWFETTWGAAYFASNLLSKGTEKRSSFDIAQRFDHYGAHFEISAGLDIVSLSLYTLTKNLAPTLSLLHELLQEAVLPEKELRQLKSIYLQNLKVNHEKTSFLASKLIRKNLFGEDHPYGKELEEADIESLSREALVDHLQSHRHDLLIIVAGDITDTARKLISDTFSDYRVSPVAPRLVSSEEKKPFRQLQEKEGSIQSSLRVAKEAISRVHADYPAVLFLNHLLGGYFGSRLMKNIREDKGFTYGIHSSLHTLHHKSYFIIGADVNKENLEATFHEIRKEMNLLRTEAIGEEELDTARNHFIGSLQSEMTTPFAHADKIKNMLLFNLPDNFYQNLIRKVDQLTPDELQSIAQRYFTEDSFFEVAVG